MLNKNEVKSKIKSIMTASKIKKLALKDFWDGNLSEYHIFTVMSRNEYDQLTKEEQLTVEKILDNYAEELQKEISCPLVRITSEFACDANLGLCFYLNATISN